ncbi:TonB-dependent receptor [Novosphingobium sp. H3SJ31-1]|uniref:TonB-dependent receptor n=2 Tax=Novosphingobium album (ex Liu et al. 2023) TaxID=3031130 RepID=A0ABT5WTG4_9SPHN|nr:TonB-dependent receptor [Novosphingobium album (ex Liu et al. 2023)]
MAHAQDAADAGYDDEAIVVTATRRASTVQDVPINISAVTASQLEEQRTQDLGEIARTVPGVYIVDAGQRQGNNIVFRGLNADPLGSNDGDNSGGGTVAIYLGEIPLYVDLRANDLERVEFLIGPQGTLYGAGTLGGAIRYIPKRPQFDAVSGEVRTDLYAYNHGDGISTDTGMTINFPIASNLAFRASLDYLNDQGFIDYPFVVTAIGQVNPNDFAGSGNLKRFKDVNWVDTVSGRAALRWKPIDALDVNLTYYYQDQRTGGRQISGYRLGQTPLLDSNGDYQSFPVPIGKYDSPLRVLEPNQRKNQLVALEMVADLDFADLTSATGYSRFDDKGNRDQTDLLITLEYSYEAFPNFTSRTLEQGKEETFTQELRLVSKTPGPLSWILGGFYNHQKSNSFSKEFTPFLDTYYGTVYPENLEYYQVSKGKLEEKAVYGELSYKITPQWQVTAGGRYYWYDFVTESAFDLPLFEVAFNGREPGTYVLDFEKGGQKDKGFLWKLNTSYDVTPDAMVYATVSKGYRIGNSNGIAACPPDFDPTDPSNGQTLCALPHEFQYGPDETTNYEIGFKTQWLNRRLTINGAAYYIDWSNPQLSSATQAGNLPIIINGGGAESKGFELSFAFQATRAFSIRGNYSYTDPKLTADTPNLIRYSVGPGFPSLYEDGLKGDRLPGSPRHSGSLFIDYKREVAPDTELGFSYKLSAQSNVLTRTGGRGGGVTLPGFSIHGAAITLNYKGLSVQGYVDNIFDKFAEVGVRGTPDSAQVVFNENGDPVYVRSYGTYPIAPRVIGLRSTLSF